MFCWFHANFSFGSFGTLKFKTRNLSNYLGFALIKSSITYVASRENDTGKVWEIEIQRMERAVKR
jgi:hypothetical protein